MRMNKEKTFAAMARKMMRPSDLAKKCNLSNTTTSSAINGKRNISTVTAGKIARALDTDVAELLEY